MNFFMLKLHTPIRVCAVRTDSVILKCVFRVALHIGQLKSIVS